MFLFIPPCCLQDWNYWFIKIYSASTKQRHSDCLLRLWLNCTHNLQLRLWADLRIISLISSALVYTQFGVGDDVIREYFILQIDPQRPEMTWLILLLSCRPAERTLHHINLTKYTQTDIDLNPDMSLPVCGIPAVWWAAVITDLKEHTTHVFIPTDHFLNLPAVFRFHFFPTAT